MENSHRKWGDKMATLNTHWRGFWNYNNGEYSLSAVDSTSLDFGISYGYVNSMTTNDIYITFRDNTSVESFLMSLPRPSIPYMIMWLYIANSYIDVNAMTPNHLPTRGRRLFELKNQNPFEFHITPELVEEVKEKGVILTGEHNGSNSGYKMLFKPTYTVLSEYPPATLSNLLQQGEYWERPITVSWLSDNQGKYEAELWQNNIKVGDAFTGLTSKSLVIPANTFSSKENALIKIRIANAQGIWTEWATLRLSLKDIEATITNLLVSSEYWEKDIELSWQSTDQEQLKIEVFKDNTVVKNYTGTTSSRYVIPAETLTAGTYTFKVWVGYANRFVNFATKNVTLKDIVPTIAELNLSGSNIDYSLTLGWTSTDQQKYEAEILKDEELKNSLSGTLDKQIVFPNNTLETGNYTFRVRVGYKDRWSEWAKTTVTLIESFPSIGAFEPDSIMVKKEEDIRIWWTSTNQSSWEIKIDSTLTYTGTYETEKILPPNTLTVGNHKLTLIVTYRTALGVEKKVSKTVEFKVQGKPPLPTFTSGNMFMTSLPVISWDTQEQQGYLLEILKDDVIVWTTNWQNGLVTRQKVLKILEDGTYKARLKIMNVFTIESDYAIQEFTVSTNEVTEIGLQATQIDKYIQLTWDNINDTFNVFFIIRDGIYIGKTSETTYNDYTACNKHDYVIVGLNFNNVAKYSNLVNIGCSIDGCVMATVDNLTDMINVGHVVNNYNFSGSINLTGEAIYCTGREKPVMVWGEHLQATYTLKFIDDENYFRFLEMCKRRQVFCYRDRNQKLFLSVNAPKYDLDNILAEYNITALEVDYSEVVDID